MAETPRAKKPPGDLYNALPKEEREAVDALVAMALKNIETQQGHALPDNEKQEFIETQRELLSHPSALAHTKKVFKEFGGLMNDNLAQQPQAPAVDVIEPYYEQLCKDEAFVKVTKECLTATAPLEAALAEKRAQLKILEGHTTPVPGLHPNTEKVPINYGNKPVPKITPQNAAYQKAGQEETQLKYQIEQAQKDFRVAFEEAFVTEEFRKKFPKVTIDNRDWDKLRDAFLTRFRKDNHDNEVGQKPDVPVQATPTTEQPAAGQTP